LQISFLGFGYFFSASSALCHDRARFIFGIPWATKMRCQRSSCCHTSPSHDLGCGCGYGYGSIDTLADGGPDPDQGDPQSDRSRSPSLHLTPEIDAPLRPSRATLIRQNIDTLTCGVGY